MNETALKSTPTEPEGPIRIDNKGNLIGAYDIGRYKSAQNVAAPTNSTEGRYATLGDAYAASVVGSAGVDSTLETKPREQPADTEQPEYQHFGQAEPEQTVAEQIQQAQQDPILRDLERLGTMAPEGVTGGGNADSLDGGKISEELEAEYQRIMNTPLSELNTRELEARKQIELSKIKNELDVMKEAEIAEALEEHKRLYITLYNEKSQFEKDYIKMDGIETADQFAQKCLEENSYTENAMQKIDEMYDLQYKDEKKVLKEEYEPYILAPAVREEIKERVFDIEYLKDPKIVELSPELKEVLLQTIKNSADLQNQSGKDGIDRVNIEFCETYSCNLGPFDGYFLYRGISEYEQDGQGVIVDELLGKLPGVSQIIKANKIANDPEFAPNDDINNNLGGKYIISTFIFTVQGNLNKVEIGQQYYLGTVIYKDDILMDSGETVEYPYNCAGCEKLSEKDYNYIKIAFQAEGTGGNSW